MYVKCPDQGTILPIPDDCPDLVEIDPKVRASASVRFQRRGWDPDFYGLAVAADFSKQPWSERVKIDSPPANDSDQTAQELGSLFELARSMRRQRLSEILAQNIGFPDYFLRLLMMDSATHPDTFLVMKAAARVSEMLMAHFKFKFQRPRPQQLAPALMPPISAQNHASYPSGHTMMSQLMAHCLADVVPATYREGLRAIADRVGHNREIAGVHYHSDTIAGQSVADQAHKVFGECRRYRDLIEEAAKEWGSSPTN